MCIDICPVGALTSGIYRYKTRPWEMKHVGHHLHALFQRLQDHARRRDNGDRARQQPRPLGDQRRVPLREGPLWVRLRAQRRAAAVAADESRRQAGAGLLDRGAGRGGRQVQRGQGARRQVRRHRLHPHHQRRELLSCRSSRARGSAPATSIITAPATSSACWTRCRARPSALATVRRTSTSARPCWWSASDLAQQHPLLAFQIRANWRHHQARVYVVTPRAGARRRICRAQRAGGSGRRNWLRWNLCARRSRRSPNWSSSSATPSEAEAVRQSGGVRRFARHPGEIRVPGGLLEFARRDGYGPAAGSGAGLPAVAEAGLSRATRCWRRRISTRCGWLARTR